MKSGCHQVMKGEGLILWIPACAGMTNKNEYRARTGTGACPYELPLKGGVIPQAQLWEK